MAPIEAPILLYLYLESRQNKDVIIDVDGSILLYLYLESRQNRS